MQKGKCRVENQKSKLELNKVGARVRWPPFMAKRKEIDLSTASENAAGLSVSILWAHN